MVGRLRTSTAAIFTDLCKSGAKPPFFMQIATLRPRRVPQIRDDTGALRGGDLAHPSAATTQLPQQVPHRARLEDLPLRGLLTQTARLAAALVARQPGHRRLHMPAPPEQRLPVTDDIHPGATFPIPPPDP